MRDRSDRVVGRAAAVRRTARAVLATMVGLVLIAGCDSQTETASRVTDNAVAARAEIRTDTGTAAAKTEAGGSATALPQESFEPLPQLDESTGTGPTGTAPKVAASNDRSTGPDALGARAIIEESANADATSAAVASRRSVHAPPERSYASAAEHRTRRRRLADDRPDLNARRLQASGIRTYRSERLILLTDVADAGIANLPQLADQLFAALEDHFGPLPPAVDGSRFQVTGCLIGDEAKFRTAGLLPADNFSFQHGRHVNYQFWMFNQQHDYYRRHLLLHEFTHCFMTCESGMNDIPPLWYIEGMAEYFATHRRAADNSDRKIPSDHDNVEFGVLPTDYASFEGWGRISELRRRTLSDSDSLLLNIRPLTGVMPTTVVTFDTDIQYAQSWAVCWLLQTHPVYRSEFARLRHARTREQFLQSLAQVPLSIRRRLAIDWLLVRESLREGFDTTRSFPQHCDQPLQSASPAPVVTKLRAAADWQQVPITVAQDEELDVSCAGRFQINGDAQPWISEPQGVTVNYFRHWPLGQIIGIFVSADRRQVSKPMQIGTEAHLRAPFDGTLWLQANDGSFSRSNNAGEIRIEITSAQ